MHGQIISEWQAWWRQHHAVSILFLQQGQTATDGKVDGVECSANLIENLIQRLLGDFTLGQKAVQMHATFFFFDLSL